jgi:Tol biopolymer transport system component
MKITRLTMRLAAATVLVCALTVSIKTSSSRPADPDTGSQIVFAGNQSGTFQLYTMHPDGSHIVQITHMASTEFETWTPDISPDGRRIVFCYAEGKLEDNAPAEIYTINVDGSDLKQITMKGVFDCAPRWSPDGSQIIFARAAARTGRAVVATMRPDGSQIHNLTTDLWGVFHSGFTPDRRHIVWESQQAGFISVLWIMNADGSNQRRLTPPAIKAAS